MLKVQLALAAREVPQVVVAVKSAVAPASVPTVNVSVALPELVSVSTCGALLWPMVVLGNVSEAEGEMVSCALVGGGPLDELPLPQPARRERAKNTATTDVLRSMLESCLLLITRMPDYSRLLKRRD